MEAPNMPGSESNRPKPSDGKATLGSILRDVLETVIPATLLALLISHFVAQGTHVYGQSMEPNLHTDQRVIVEKVSYLFHIPRRGDIVVIDVDFSDIPLIKRVIGLPGETVEVRGNQVFIDGEPLEEPYLSRLFQRDFGPTVVPPDHVFVMGDNRGASSDSRVHGPFPVSRILGRAWLSYWPLQDVGLVK
jgi:signal peptidase I